MKYKLKSYNFWIGVISAIILLLQTLGAQLDMQYIDKVVNSFLGILAVVGILDKPVNAIEGENLPEGNINVSENLQDSKDTLEENNQEKNMQDKE